MSKTSKYIEVYTNTKNGKHSQAGSRTYLGSKCIRVSRQSCERVVHIYIYIYISAFCVSKTNKHIEMYTYADNDKHSQAGSRTYLGKLPIYLYIYLFIIYMYVPCRYSYYIYVYIYIYIRIFVIGSVPNSEVISEAVHETLDDGDTRASKP